MHTDGNKYLTKLSMETRYGSISLKDKRLINCCIREIESLLLEQVQTRTLDFSWYYSTRRISVYATHISLWRYRHSRIGSFKCNCITQRSQGWIKFERDEMINRPIRVEWSSCFVLSRSFFLWRFSRWMMRIKVR